VYSEAGSYLRGTERVRRAWISRLLDEWPAYQRFVVRVAVGLEDVRRVLRSRVLHLVGSRPAGLCRRSRDLPSADDDQLPPSALGGHQLRLGAVSTLRARHPVVSSHSTIQSLLNSGADRADLQILGPSSILFADDILVCGSSLPAIH